ncbi:hypothetical protein WA158_001657 [Blastocystis sp. Blastoise]
MSESVDTVFTMMLLDKDFKRERNNMFTKRNRNSLLDIRDGAEGFVKSVTNIYYSYYYLYYLYPSFLYLGFPLQSYYYSYKAGVTSFMDYICLDHIHPEWHMLDTFVTENNMGVLSEDCIKSSHPIEITVNRPEEVSQIFDGISYSKGATVIWMLYNFIGREAFRKDISSYLTTFKYKNTATENLWKHLSCPAGIDDIYIGWNIPLVIKTTNWKKKCIFTGIPEEDSQVNLFLEENQKENGINFIVICFHNCSSQVIEMVASILLQLYNRINKEHYVLQFSIIAKEIIYNQLGRDEAKEVAIERYNYIINIFNTYLLALLSLGYTPMKSLIENCLQMTLDGRVRAQDSYLPFAGISRYFKNLLSLCSLLYSSLYISHGNWIKYSNKPLDSYETILNLYYLSKNNLISQLYKDIPKSVYKYKHILLFLKSINSDKSNHISSLSLSLPNVPSSSLHIVSYSTIYEYIQQHIVYLFNTYNQLKIKSQLPNIICFLNYTSIPIFHQTNSFYFHGYFIDPFCSILVSLSLPIFLLIDICIYTNHFYLATLLYDYNLYLYENNRGNKNTLGKPLLSPYDSVMISSQEKEIYRQKMAGIYQEIDDIDNTYIYTNKRNDRDNMKALYIVDSSLNTQESRGNSQIFLPLAESMSSLRLYGLFNMYISNGIIDAETKDIDQYYYMSLQSYSWESPLLLDDTIHSRDYLASNSINKGVFDMIRQISSSSFKHINTFIDQYMNIYNNTLHNEKSMSIELLTKYNYIQYFDSLYEHNSLPSSSTILNISKHLSSSLSIYTYSYISDLYTYLETIMFLHYQSSSSNNRDSLLKYMEKILLTDIYTILINHLKIYNIYGCKNEYIYINKRIEHILQISKDKKIDLDISIYKFELSKYLFKEGMNNHTLRIIKQCITESNDVDKINQYSIQQYKYADIVTENENDVSKYEEICKQYTKKNKNWVIVIIDVQTPTPLFPSMVYINRKSIQSISEGKNDSEMYRMINRKCECSGCGIEFKQNVPFYYISTPSIFLSKSTHRNPLQQLLLNTYTERYIVIVLH